MATPNPPNPQTGGPPPKKSNPLLWILIGCGGLIVIVGLVMLAGGLFVFHKAKQAGLDPELMKENPALAVSKMIATVNPDIEVLKVDEDSGRITVRDKKSGKTVTVDFDDLKDGKITFEGEEGETATIETEGKGEGEGSFRLSTPEGTVEMGAAAGSDLPDWAPAYPGAKLDGLMKQQQSGGATSATFSFETGDSVEQVLEFYSQRLKAGGFQISVTSQGPDGGMVSAEDSAHQRKILLVLGAENGKTTGTLTCMEGE